MSERTRITSAFLAHKFKTDPRTAQLALEKLYIEGKVKRTKELINGNFQHIYMWVYQKI